MTKEIEQVSIETASIRVSYALMDFFKALIELGEHKGGLDRVALEFLREQGSNVQFKPEEFLEFALRGSPKAPSTIVQAKYRALMESIDRIHSTPEWEGAGEEGRTSLGLHVLDECLRDAESRGLLSKEEVGWVQTGFAISTAHDSGISINWEKLLKFVGGSDDLAKVKRAYEDAGERG